MSWRDIIKANTMEQLSDSNKAKIEDEREKYERSIEGDSDVYTFEEMVDELLSEGQSVSEVVRTLQEEYLEWFDSTEGQEWALDNGDNIREYQSDVADMRRDLNLDDDDDDGMEEMERRSERSADAYFSGQGYNTGYD